MITPGPITAVGATVDISVVAPGTIFTPDNKSFWILTNNKSMVNLSNGILQPVPATPLPVSPLPGANLALG